MFPLWRRGVCFLLGNPEAAISWISREDAVRLIAFALESEQNRGPLNVVAPHAITQRTLVTSFAGRLARSVIGHAPAWLLRVALGEFATALLDDQRVVPAAAEAAGFCYQHPAWRSYLDHHFSQSASDSL
jgi:NAD dependent epimerase/dehydratase family enzyme